MTLNGRVKKIEELDMRLSVAETQLGAHLAGKAYWLESTIGLNGQIKRKAVFEEIVKRIKFDAIVETGTNLGFSTGYMASFSSLPVFSCEIDPLRYTLSKKILAPHFNNIILIQSNSIDYLKQIQNTKQRDTLFFYLDAHWYKYLPLREEIEIIGSCWENVVILIDDFKVNGDPGYSYDNYGKVGTLELDFILDLVAKYQFSYSFPSFKASEETGAKRGYIILSKGSCKPDIEQMQSLKTSKP